MTKTFIAVKDEKIIARFITDQGIAGIRRSLEAEGTADADAIEIPYESRPASGEDVRIYDKGWNLRPLTDLAAEGLFAVPPAMKIFENTLVPKTLGEQITDGEVTVPDGMMYDAATDSIIPDPAYIPPKPTIEVLEAQLLTLLGKATEIQADIASLKAEAVTNA